ncbi:MAG: sulfatase-like hydrolase/transferase, partial [Thermoleophilaceae bacterium]|nr:sulfatase-like hydrolase/transferase [Thermoleophilaceae bacterium]
VSPVSRLVRPGQEVEASDVAIPGQTPIVMILYDELSGTALMGRDGRVKSSLFPNFAKLAGTSTWYRNASTVADFTSQAVPALLTGELPSRSAAPIAADHPESIFTLLGGKYPFDVTEPVTDVCPVQLCPSEASSTQSFGERARELASDLSLVSLHLIVPDDIERDLPPVDRSFGDFRDLAADGNAADDPGAAARRGLAALVAFTERVKEYREFNARLGTAGPERSFRFLHVQIPHNPYYLLPDTRRYPETLAPIPGLDQPGPAGTWRDDPWLTRQALQRYVLQIEAGDRLLGESIARMKASGLWDRALVVVTADHGASFEPGAPHRAATLANLPQIANVPLFVKSPGQREPRVVDGNVKTIDILPTIADELRVPLPWGTAGRPAARAGDGGRIVMRSEYQEGDLTMPFGEFVRRRDSIVRSIGERIGTTRAGVYRIGPDDDLVGRRADELGAGSTRAEVELDAGGLYASVDPGAPVVPSFVTGRARDLPPGSRLAITIDGVVAATTRPFDDDGGPGRFAAIVPPSVFSRGPDPVGVLAVTGAGANRRILSLRGVTVSYRLAEGGGALLDPAGRRIPIVKTPAGGRVDGASADEADVKVQGWAGTVEPARRADRVVAFAGDRYIASARPSLPREDLEKRYGPALANAGFSIRGGVSAGPQPGSDAAPWRVYAIVGGRAHELRFPSVTF